MSVNAPKAPAASVQTHDQRADAKIARNLGMSPLHKSPLQRAAARTRGVRGCAPLEEAVAKLLLTPPISLNEKRDPRVPFLVEMGGVEPPSE